MSELEMRLARALRELSEQHEREQRQLAEQIEELQRRVGALARLCEDLSGQYAEVVKLFEREAQR